MVLCAGIAVEDFIFKVERFPRPGEKAQASTLIATAGGCAANAAIAVSRLGGDARFTGPIGEPLYGIGPPTQCLWFCQGRPATVRPPRAPPLRR